MVKIKEIDDKIIGDVERKYSQLVQDEKKKSFYIDWLDLVVTENCNFKCTYCFVDQKENNMTFETAIEAIEWGLKLANPDKKFIVNFFGGEPFLRKELLLQVLNKYKENCKVEFTLSTNGSIFDEELVDALVANKVNFQVSLDGIEEAQNAHRGNFDLVYMNVRKYLGKTDRVSAHPTITPETIKHLSKSIQMFYDLGFSAVAAQCMLEGTWSDESLQLYREQYRKVGDFYLSLIEKNSRPFRIKFLSEAITGLLNGTIRRKSCSAGDSLFAVDSKGDIYPCHRFIKHNLFNLGNIRGEFKGNAFKDITMDKMIGCKDCLSKEACHICLCANYEMNKDLLVPSESYCKLIQIESEEALRVIEKGKTMPKFREIFKMTDNNIEARLARIEDILLKLSAVILDMNITHEEKI